MSRSDDRTHDHAPFTLDVTSPELLHDWVPQRLLVVCARPRHAEDEVGGSVARWITHGAVARLVCCTSGDADAEDPSADPFSVAAEREREQRAAAQVIGYESVSFLHRPDGAIANDLALREQLVRLVRAFRPDTVALPDPRFIIGPDGRINDSDRRAAGLAVIDAIGPAREAMAFPTLAMSGGLAPWSVERLVLTGSQEPNAAVDISHSIDRKVSALHAHAGDGRDPARVETDIRERAASANYDVAAVEMLSVIQLHQG